MASEPDVAVDIAAQLQLTAALAEYMQTVPTSEKQQAQSELAKFSRWVGGDRDISSLAPPEIGEYSDVVSARGTAPDASERLAVVKLFLTYLKKQGYIDTGLSQHLRVRRGRGANKATKSSTEVKVVNLTRQGHAEMLKRLEGYMSERQGLAEDIQRAAQDKDVRENAPLEAAREAQGQLMSRIAEIEATLRAAVVIDDSAGRGAGQIVRLGTNVTIKDMSTGKSMNCQIVEPNEADPFNSKISRVSPVGAGVLGKVVGDEFTVNTPRGKQTFSVVRTR